MVRAAVRAAITLRRSSHTIRMYSTGFRPKKVRRMHHMAQVRILPGAQMIIMAGRHRAVII